MRRITVITLSLLIASLIFADPAGARGRRRKPPPVDPELAKVVDPLLVKLGDPSFEVREEATFALMEMGPDARPAVVRAANHSSPEVRARVQRVLLHYRELERRRGLGPSPANEWPMFKRGPGRLASSGLRAVPKEPEVRWSRLLEEPLGGLYFDSPLLATEDRLFVVSRAGEVTALDRETGEERWRERTGEPVLASPVLAGDTLYVPGRSLTAMDARNGRVRWRWATDYGISAPPLVQGAHIFAVEKGEKLVSLNAADGEVEWKRRIAATASTPVLAGEYIVVGTGNGLWALDREDGSRRWVFPTKFPIAASPAVLADRIIFGDEGRHVFAVTPDRGKAIWRRRIPEGSLLVAPAIYGDAILFSTTGASFRALRSGDGADLWSRNVGSLRPSSPCVAGGIAYFTAGCHLHAMHCSSGDDAFRMRIAGPFCSPILMDGTLYLVSMNGVVLAYE